MVVRPLKQTGKVKKTRLNGCLMSWLEILKNRPFEVLSSLILLNNEPFPDRIVTKADCIRQQATSSSSGWTEKQLLAAYQSQTCTKKGSWSLSSGLLQVWSTTAFWILAKSLLLRSLLSKLMQYTANFNVCSWHWSTERAQFLSTTPYCTLHNQRFKSWTNWATKFCLICHIHLTSWLPRLQASWQLFAGKHFNQQDVENCFPIVCWIPKHRFLSYRSKQPYFSLTKMCWV